METKELLENFVKSRENNGKIIAAFGYGSGVFKQTGYSLQKQPMIDTIFIVENSHLWHKENIKTNPSDYSIGGRIALNFFDINAIKKATGVTYQSDIRFMDNTFKYGVIEKEQFMKSMMGNWDSFFIQGRFQKPTYTIFSTQEIDEAIEKNKELAILVALLTLTKKSPTIYDLYHQICSLSYNGDIRMIFAENPQKTTNIVQGSLEHFFRMYGTKNKYFYTTDSGLIIINKDILYKSLHALPKNLYDHLQSQKYPIDNHEIISTLLKEKIAKINRHDSIIQPITGILTSGPIKSLAYLEEKIKKKTMK